MLPPAVHYLEEQGPQQGLAPTVSPQPQVLLWPQDTESSFSPCRASLGTQGYHSPKREGILLNSHEQKAASRRELGDAVKCQKGAQAGAVSCGVGSLDGRGGTKMEKTAMAAPEIHVLGALLGSLITHWHIPDRQLLSQTAIKAKDSLNKYGFK